MSKLKALLFMASLSLIGHPEVSADGCPPGTTLKSLNGFYAGTTDAQTISTAGALIRASRVACGGTACRATLYNDDGNSPGGNGNSDSEIKDEPGAPANESRWTEYDPPLDLSEGVSLSDDGNVTGFGVFICR